MLGSVTKDKDTYAVLPLRDIVVFPHMIVPLFVGREKSVKALEAVMQESKKILLVTQKSPSEDDPTSDDIHMIGTVGSILQLLKLPDGTVKVLVEGIERVEISGFTGRADFIEATVKPMADTSVKGEELDALARAVVAQFEQYVKLNKKIPPEVIVSVNQIEDSAKMADTIASHLSLKIEEKQELLATANAADRLEKIYG